MPRMEITTVQNYVRWHNNLSFLARDSGVSLRTLNRIREGKGMSLGSYQTLAKYFAQKLLQPTTRKEAK